MAGGATLDPVAHDGRSRLVGLIFWVVLPVVALVAVIAASVTFSHRVNEQPQGTKGTYVAQIRSCQGNVCQVAGTFTSDDDLYTVRSVLGDYRWKVGEKHRVVLNPQSEIIALPAQWNPVATVVGGAGGLIFLVVWGGFVVSGIRSRRGPRWAGSSVNR
jgi:hypothetical protein